ncbi:MAG: hypothetical protein COB77_02225 [Gammaproteobacteria bacterium]|nr:MAG: hypothetical protein COB77_02225 [Gammaproteobacteria bacterium]
MPIYNVIAVFFLFISTNSYAGDLFDMLQRMADANQNQNYQGVFILRKSDKLSTIKVSHGADENGVWESLTTLNGRSKKVVRRNSKIYSIYPDRELITIRHRAEDQSLHLQLPDNINQLDLFYSLNRLDDDRIAGYQALVVDLIPKDQYRYGYRYWVDIKTGMLLRCDMVAEDKTVVQQMMFTSLQYLEASPVPSFDLSHFGHYQQILLDMNGAKDLRNSPTQWVVNVLPKGFRLTQSMMRNSTTDNKDTTGLVHMVYSDGLASVSIFIEQRRSGGKHVQGVSSMGAVNAYGLSVDDYFVTVVGEVPVKTVQSMARSTVKLSAGTSN